MHQQVLSIASDLLHLIEFVDLNVTGIRKILKKHDRVMRGGKRVLIGQYLFFPSDRVELTPLLEYVGLDAMIQTLQALWQVHVPTSRADTVAEGHKEMDHLFLAEYRMEEVVAGLLKSIHSAREDLQKTSDFVNMLAAQMLMEEASEEEERKEEGEEGLSSLRRFSNWLNFCSTFLHLTDYYVVAPGCGSYAKLGLGFAALVSTLIYSHWTSWSYRGPLVFATICQIMGVIVYALALPLGGSLKLVMLGRLLSGFGSARALNRRYIADTFPVRERTAASATFVTAGALGTSAGPALAAALYAVVPDASTSLLWRVENAPCWVMALVWSIYLVFILLFFEEPESNKMPAMKIELTGQDSEHKRLLSDQTAVSTKTTASTEDSRVVQPLWENKTVMLTFVIYFVLKFILESLLSSSAILTGYYFDWNDGDSGSYLAMLGLLVLPANWVSCFCLRSRRSRICQVVFLLDYPLISTTGRSLGGPAL